jgi:hypothetical protein
MSETLAILDILLHYTAAKETLSRHTNFNVLAGLR